MLQNLDLWLLHKLNVEWTNPALDRLLPTVTNLGAWMPLIVVLVLIAAIRGGTRARLLILTVGIAIGIGDGIISKTLKTAVGRLRPHEVRTDVVTRALPKAKPAMLAMFRSPVVKNGEPAKAGSRGNSFPSSHTINMFSVATACLMILGRRAWWMVIVATLVAWSRVYCGSHWPSDLAASIPLGILCGWIAVRITGFLWQRYGKRFFPTAYGKMPALAERP